MSGRPSRQDEAEIVARAKREPREFAPLYDRYVDAVFRYCYRRLGSREAAEDATSQIFYQAMAALGRYHGPSFRSWLFAIAHNVVVDTYRRQRPHAPLDVVTDPEDGAPTPEEIVLAHERRYSVRRLLDHLSPLQREVVELRLAGLTGLEIADALGRNHGAVKAIQFRAIARLRELLGVESTATREPDDEYR